MCNCDKFKYILKYFTKESGGLFLISFLILALPFTSYAGTTGKLSGKVTEAESGEPILGANVIIEGTYGGCNRCRWLLLYK